MWRRDALETRIARLLVLGVVSLYGFQSSLCSGLAASLPEPKMSYLDNGVVRVGIDLTLGGAVTFVSSQDHPGNIINSADLGRQIQMSHYSGPWPFEVGDKKPHPAWAGLGWNPIQTGDVHHNPSQVVEHRNDGKEIYIQFYEHRTEFMVGKLNDIRAQFNRMAAKLPPAWRFERDRQHWTVRDATDQGFPLDGAWRIKLGDKTPRLQSGVRCWRADDAPGMRLRIAYTGPGTSIRVFWKRLGDGSFDSQRSLSIPLNADGTFHTYPLDLKSSPNYRGLITGLALDPVHQPQPNGTIAIQSIELVTAP